MMSTILTIIIMGMLLQGVMAVIDSVLDTENLNSMLKSNPEVASHHTLNWANHFLEISNVNDGGGVFGYGASTEILQMGRFGADIATAIAILAFIPIRDAAISALGKGIGGR